MPRRTFFVRPLLLAAALGAIFTSGCSSLDVGQMALFDSPPPPKRQPAPGSPNFFIEFHSGSEKPQRASVPLDKPMFASEAIKMANAKRRYSRFDAHIVRKTPNGTLKMALPSKGESGVLDVQSDYSIFPGDRLVIVQNHNTALDEMLDSALKPLAFMRR